MKPPWLVPDPWEGRDHLEWRRRRANPEWADAVGFLHDLRCAGHHYKPYRGCQPIAVYRYDSAR